MRTFIEMGLLWGRETLPAHVLSPNKLAFSISPAARDATRVIASAFGLSWSFPAQPLASTRQLTEQFANWLSNGA